MHASAYLRRLSRQFSISAPRMAVRTHLGWPWRACIGLVFAALVGGMWWWGFDFGQLFSGLRREEVDSQLASLGAELTATQREAAALRSENAQLASDLAMMRGIQATLHRQQVEAAQENASLKEELSFLQSFFADATKAVGPAIHRLAVTAEAPGVARYSILMVRGVGAKGEFDGHLAVVADAVPTDQAPPGSKALAIALPDDRPETAGSLRLRFKYYQRLEGTLRVPPGYAVRAVTARAYEAGTATPRATRTLTLP
jgi:hypothetical protein